MKPFYIMRASKFYSAMGARCTTQASPTPKIVHRGVILNIDITRYRSACSLCQFLKANYTDIYYLHIYIALTFAAYTKYLIL